VITAPVNLSALYGPTTDPVTGAASAPEVVESGEFSSALELEIARRMELERIVRPDTPPALDKTPEQKAVELEKAAKGLEGLLLSQLLKAMDRTVDKGELFGGSFGGRISRELFLEKVGEELASDGGIGLASVLKRQLGDDAGTPKSRPLAFKL